MKPNFSSATLLVVLTVLFNCSSEEKDPADTSSSIVSISPESGPEGTLVSIIGTGFSGTPGENSVKFNGIEGVVQLEGQTGIAATVPPGATTGKVSVTTAGKTVEGPVFTVVEGQQVVTKTYYLKFKANGTIKIFEEGNPGYSSCGDCACSYMPVLSETRYAGLDICNESNDWITAADIQGWNGDKILFSEANFPNVSLGYEENDIFYSTSYAADQTGSEVNITAVTADGEYLGNKAYKVSGNFKCKVADGDGVHAQTITEGTFVIRYSED
jgi:hypothetical protein